jgi:hypothetical protein
MRLWLWLPFGREARKTGQSTPLLTTRVRNFKFVLRPQGFVVFAGCLAVEGEGARKLKKEAGDNIVLVQMNVVSDEEIESALEFITEDIEKRGFHGKCHKMLGVGFK